MVFIPPKREPTASLGRGFDVNPEPVEPEREAPSVFEGLWHGFTEENVGLGLITHRGYRGEVDEDFDVFEEMEGTKYEGEGDTFGMYAVNKNIFDQMVQQYEDEEEADAALAAAGTIGEFVYRGIGAAFSPEMAIPGTAAVRGATTAAKVGTTALKTSLLAGTATAGAEAMLQSQQLTRTLQESGLNIAGALILGGGIGGAAGYIGRKNNNAFTAGMNAEEAAEVHRVLSNLDDPEIQKMYADGIDEADAGLKEELKGLNVKVDGDTYTTPDGRPADDIDPDLDPDIDFVEEPVQKQFIDIEEADFEIDVAELREIEEADNLIAAENKKIIDEIDAEEARIDEELKSNNCPVF